MTSRIGTIDRLNTEADLYPRVNGIAAAAVMFITALFFACWAMRGASNTDLCYTDQARHAMNGAALHDLVRDRALNAPVAYLRDYFARYPALSMPYHPPVFPVIEAAFYSMLGSSVVTARFVVALFVFGVGILLFRLVIATEASIAQAYASVVLFLSLPISQRLAGDVMLEMPALFFTLASFLFIYSLPQDWTIRKAILAGLFAGVAVWTKQTVFIGLVPFLIIFISRRWLLVRTSPVWIFGALYAVFVVALAALWAQAGGSGFAAQWREAALFPRLTDTVLHYGRILARPSVAAFLLLLAALAIATARHNPRNRLRVIVHPLYVAWVAAVALILLVVPAADERYLWFAYPAACIIFVSLTDRFLRIVLPIRAARCVVVCAAFAFFIANAKTALPRLTGPSEAARFIVARGPGRVLVGGSNNGSIIFAIRSIYAGHEIAIIRADKLPPEVFSADGMESFAHRFGLNTLVFDSVPTPERHQKVMKTPAPSMHLERVIDQHSSDPKMEGKIVIYRFLNPSSTPESTLPIPVFSTGQQMDLQYK